MVVVHGDAGQTDAGTVSWIKSPTSRVSYHYLVGRDTTVYQFVPEAEKAWHAGRSAWDGCTVGNSVNPTSVGLSFANNGTEPFGADQIQAGAELCANICKRHTIPVHMVRGHFEVSPGRKADPWQHFPWPAFWLALCEASR